MTTQMQRKNESKVPLGFVSVHSVFLAALASEQYIGELNLWTLVYPDFNHAVSRGGLQESFDIYGCKDKKTIFHNNAVIVAVEGQKRYHFEATPNTNTLSFQHKMVLQVILCTYC